MVPFWTGTPTKPCAKACWAIVANRSRAEHVFYVVTGLFVGVGGACLHVTLMVLWDCISINNSSFSHNPHMEGFHVTCILAILVFNYKYITIIWWQRGPMDGSAVSCPITPVRTELSQLLRGSTWCHWHPKWSQSRLYKVPFTICGRLVSLPFVFQRWCVKAPTLHVISWHPRSALFRLRKRRTIFWSSARQSCLPSASAGICIKC